MEKQQRSTAAKSSLEQATFSQGRIDRIKAILIADEKGTASDIPI